MTVWKTVPRFPWLQVSSDGNVRRIIVAKNGRKPGPIVGCVFNNGYRYLDVGGSAGDLKIGFHVLVCEAFHGPAPSPSHEVAHDDGDKLNNRHGNVSWKTPKGNADDRTRHGNTLRGERVATSKIVAADVVEIRRLKQAGFTGLEIGRRFGLNRNTVNKIAVGKYWHHV